MAALIFPVFSALKLQSEVRSPDVSDVCILDVHCFVGQFRCLLPALFAAVSGESVVLERLSLHLSVEFSSLIFLSFGSK